MNAYLSLIGRGRGGRLFEARRLLTFSAFRMGAYSRWALIRGWALIRINTVRRTSFVYKTSRLVRIYLLISALNKRVLLFSSGKLFYKNNRKLFPCVCISRYKHERGWENSQQLCVVFILGYANTENVFYCLNTKYK